MCDAVRVRIPSLACNFKIIKLNKRLSVQENIIRNKIRNGKMKFYDKGGVLRAEIIFLRHKNEIAFTVMYMDEGFRHTSGEAFSYKANNGVEIISLTYPQLCCDVIYLRGASASKDNLFCTLEESSDIEAKRRIKIYIEALKEWAENFDFNKKDSNLGSNEIEII
jgi:hypothetical protein